MIFELILDLFIVGSLLFFSIQDFVQREFFWAVVWMLVTVAYIMKTIINFKYNKKEYDKEERRNEEKGSFKN